MWWTEPATRVTTTQEEIIELAGNMQPYVVESQEEKDWLDAMQLMTGKTFVVLIKGVHKNNTGMPPTFLKLDISSVEPPVA